MKFFLSLIFAVIIFSSVPSFAAKMDIMNWQTVHITLTTTEKVGQKVDVTAEQTPQFDYTSFEVSINGKKYTLNAEQRKRLKLYPLSSIKLATVKDEPLNAGSIIIILQKGNDENSKTSGTMYIAISKLGISLSELDRENR